MSALPGLDLPGPRNGFSTKDEVAAYLETYADKQGTRVITGNGIARLWQSGNGFLARTDAGTRLGARAVVVATGPFQRPAIPSFARALSDEVQQLAAASYRSPALIVGEPVVVIGDGASGRQIARELARERRVTLATGKRRHFTPQRIFGKDSMWWFHHAGLITADKTTWIGRRVRALDSIPGWHLRSSALRREGGRIVPRAIGARGTELEFEGGLRMSCRCVIWAVGYRDDVTWIDIDGAVAGGRFVEDRGVTPVAGLFHVGREWQNTRGSALLCGVGRDASHIAHRIGEVLGRGHTRRMGSHRTWRDTRSRRPVAFVFLPRRHASGCGLDDRSALQ